jgi:hypothetical protein
MTDQPGTTPVEVPKEWWYFTFGSGQRLLATSSHNVGNSQNAEQMGFELFGFYVKFYGTRESARADMYTKWGTNWCDQYPEVTALADIAQYGLTELVLPERATE